MKTQIIEKDDRPEWAVVPYEDYRKLLAAKEMLDDVTAFDDAVAADEEEVPHAVVKQLVEGRNPIGVWRRHRGLTQRELAARAGVSPPYLSQIEKGKRTGSAKVLAAIAEVLDVAIVDLLEEDPRPAARSTAAPGTNSRGVDQGGERGLTDSQTAGSPTRCEAPPAR